MPRVRASSLTCRPAGPAAEVTVARHFPGRFKASPPAADSFWLA